MKLPSCNNCKYRCFGGFCCSRIPPFVFVLKVCIYDLNTAAVPSHLCVNSSSWERDNVSRRDGLSLCVHVWIHSILVCFFFPDDYTLIRFAFYSYFFPTRLSRCANYFSPVWKTHLQRQGAADVHHNMTNLWRKINPND